MKTRRILSILAAAILSSSNLFAQEPFYHGKMIRVIVGTSAGNSQDQMTRLVARHLPKYIPGNPVVVVENRPGASSVIAANYLFKVAKGDGLTIGVVSRALYFDQLVGRQEVQFDWTKFTWVGSPVEGNELIFVGSAVPYKSIRDVVSSGDAVKCGASGTTSTGFYIPKLMNEIFGTKFQIVTGYSGGAEMDLAVQRGETQCRATSISGFVGFGAFKDWRQTGAARVLVQTGKKRDPRLPETPTVYGLMDEFKTAEAGRRLATVVLSPGEFGWPLVAPPGVPGNRVVELRDAFMRAMADPELIAEAKKRQLDPTPSSGGELEALAKEVIAQPRDVVERMKVFLGN
jgi:tripartite-type tricarboxylate transporter receptor subunit TctC